MEAAEKARHLIDLLAANLDSSDTWCHALVSAVLADFARVVPQGPAEPEAGM